MVLFMCHTLDDPRRHILLSYHSTGEKTEDREAEELAQGHTASEW
jgi:hypothetical protein